MHILYSQLANPGFKSTLSISPEALENILTAGFTLQYHGGRWCGIVLLWKPHQFTMNHGYETFAHLSTT